MTSDFDKFLSTVDSIVVRAMNTFTRLRGIFYGPVHSELPGEQFFIFALNYGCRYLCSSGDGIPRPPAPPKKQLWNPHLHTLFVIYLGLKRDWGVRKGLRVSSGEVEVNERRSAKRLKKKQVSPACLHASPKVYNMRTGSATL